jgi:vacuolar protein sorting-associated protein 13A/C
MDLFVLLKINFITEIEIDVDIRTSPIIIFLKQRQIRLLIRAVQDLMNHRNDRPIQKPGVG